MKRKLRLLQVAALGALALSACAGAPSATGAAAPKGYLIAEIAVTNPEAYEGYKAVAAPMIASFGGRYLVRGGKAEGREGDAPEGRLIVLEFPSLEAAQAFYDSPEYSAIKPMRTDNAVSRVIIVEGTAP